MLPPFGLYLFNALVLMLDGMGWDGDGRPVVCRNFGVKIFKTDEMGQKNLQKKRKSVNLQLKTHRMS
jgi:hypothetical protein